MSLARVLKPRLHVHRGTVMAEALWFDPTLVGEREARRRVLVAWAPGLNVFEVAGGFLLRLPRAQRVDCGATPGLPLTLEEGVLTSAPLSAVERERLAPSAGSVVLVRAGRAQVFPADPSRRVEVSAWLDVSEWSVASVQGLGAPPPPVPVLEPVAPPERKLFGKGVPPAAPEAEAMRARMEGRPVPEAAKAALAAQAAASRSWWQRLRAWLRGEKGAAEAQAASITPVASASWFTRLRAWLRGSRGEAARPESPPRAEKASPSGPGAAPSSSALGRFGAWLRRALGARGAEAKAQAALPSGKAASASKAQEEPQPGSPSLLRRMLARLRQMFSTSEADERAPASAGTPPPPAEPQGPGLLSRLTEWMLLNTPLGPLLGQRKAEYMHRLFQMFEQGNLDEALRYAIPLGKGMTEQARIALGLPGPRESLALQPGRARGARSLFGGGAEIYSALQERYRAAFRKLEREGRIDEAAFVLSELLGEHEEAVSFLEKHGRLRLAAELAEGRGMAPGLVVRQWLLAKDLRRAVAIARRSGAFPDAVLRLERTHPSEARTLRLLWAETLAEAGDYLRAATVVWPLEDARPLARRWLEHGVEVGGVGGARALARLASAFPDAFEAMRAPVLSLLEDEHRERAAERLAFAEVLAAEPRSDSRMVMAGPVVRSLLRDRAVDPARVDANLLTRLLREAGDGTLRADLPPMSDARRRPWSEEPNAPLLSETLAASEAGPYPVHDAVALSGQRMLLALGEAGVRLVRADGRTLAHFDVPAFSLVPSVHEDRVVALAPRGALKRLSRIELGARRAAHWCDAKVDAFAPSHDGSLWFIAQDDTVLAVDALATDALKALWHVSDVGGHVMALEADAEWLRFATWGSDPQLWTYALPGGPTLRSRAARRTGDGLPMVVLNEVTSELEVLDQWVLMPPWMLVTAPSATGHEVKLFSRGETLRASFRFEGEARVRVRFSAGELLVFDTAGRLLRVDLAEGSARRVPLA